MWCPNCKTKSPALAVGHDELLCAKCNTEVVSEAPKPKSSYEPSHKRSSTSASSIKFATDSSTADGDVHETELESSRDTASAKFDSGETEQGSFPEVAFIERLPKQTRPKKRTRPAKRTRQGPTQNQTKTTPQPAPKKTWRSDAAHTTGQDSPAHHIDQKRLRKTDAEKPRRSTRSANNSRSATTSRSAKTSLGKSAVYFAIQLGLLIFLIGHGLTIWGFLAGNFGVWAAGSFCSVGGITIAVVSIVHALRQIDEGNASN